MADSLDLTLLATTLGDYCRENAEEMVQDILLEQPITSSGITVLDGVSDEIPLMDLVSTAILKPWGETFAPTTNALKFKPRIAKARPAKADVKITPKLLHKQYTALKKQKGANPYNLPFEDMLMRRLIAQAQEDMDIAALFEGVYDDEGDSPADIFTGWISIAEAAQSITEFEAQTTDIATITKTNGVAEVEKLISNIPSRWLKKELNLYCSPTVLRNYCLDYRDRYNGSTYNTDFNKYMVDGTMVSFFAHSGISADDKMFVSPAKNLVFVCDSEADMGNLIVERFERTLKVMLDVTAGVEFASLDFVWYAKNKA